MALTIRQVIYTASPFQTRVSDNILDLLDPAIKGTTEVLTSIQKNAPGVKRVVLTSSFASIIDMSKGTWPEHTYSEKDWNPVTYEEAEKTSDGAVAYCASKTVAERAAWDFVSQRKPNFSLSTICPPMAYSPLAHFVSDRSNLNTLSADIYRLMNGSEMEVPPMAFYAWVDVRDVAEAHARAYEREQAAGQRYFVTAGTYTYQQVCDIIREEFPELRDLTPEGETGAPLPKVYKVDNSKSRKELRLTYRDLRTSIVDMVRDFLEIQKRIGKQ
jgi:nucleoside-diphosphate-sugar epimerase